MTRQESHLSSDAAGRLVGEALRYAEAKGWAVCVAVCDASGSLLALQRGDACIRPAIDFAIDKAFTAAGLRRETEAFFERCQEKPALAQGMTNRERLLVFPGGLPIFVDGVCVGAIGVSGASDQEDVACGRAALAALGLSGSA